MTLFSLRDDKKYCLRPLLIYIGVTIFCVIFGLIYEYFSHNVLSYSMLYGFMWPLFGGVVFYAVWTGIYFLFKIKYTPSIWTSYAYNAGLATLTVGCYFHGIVEISGRTSESHDVYYTIIGVILLSAAAIFLIISIFIKIRERLNNK